MSLHSQQIPTSLLTSVAKGILIRIWFNPRRALTHGRHLFVCNYDNFLPLTRFCDFNSSFISKHQFPGLYTTHLWDQLDLSRSDFYVLKSLRLPPYRINNTKQIRDRFVQHMSTWFSFFPMNGCTFEFIHVVI